jgi:hypothetical protein
MEYWSGGVMDRINPILHCSNIPVLQLILPLRYRPHQLSPFVVGFFIVGLEEYLMAVGTAVYD